jgi:hypothetical protein
MRQCARRHPKDQGVVMFYDRKISIDASWRNPTLVPVYIKYLTPGSVYNLHLKISNESLHSEYSQIVRPYSQDRLDLNVSIDPRFLEFWAFSPYSVYVFSLEISDSSEGATHNDDSLLGGVGGTLQLNLDPSRPGPNLPSSSLQAQRSETPLLEEEGRGDSVMMGERAASPLQAAGAEAAQGSTAAAEEKEGETERMGKRRDRLDLKDIECRAMPGSPSASCPMQNVSRRTDMVSEREEKEEREGGREEKSMREGQ